MKRGTEGGEQRGMKSIIFRHNFEDNFADHMNIQNDIKEDIPSVME